MRTEPASRRSQAPDSDAALRTDPLTGLGLTREFHDRVSRLIDARAEDPAPFAITILDLDGFKPLNDLLGRGAGDEILQQVAARLCAAMDKHSAVTRFGADEFAIVLPRVSTEESAAETVRMLIEILSAPFDLGHRTVRLSASAGCSLCHSRADTTELLVDKAESALYQAKRNGRGAVVVFTSQMEEAAKRITSIEQALRRAVAAGEVEPFFQPIVELAGRRIVGFETLARWTDRDLGSVPPTVFIPIAEDRGIIGPLSQMVLRKAAKAVTLWPEDVFLSFNLSPSQLVDHQTGHQILTILEQTRLDPRRLELEITETGLMNDPASAEKIIDELRAMGMRVSLDDFGTGQSSLGRLRDFQFDKLKIDRAFVSTVLSNRSSEHIVRAILSMCEGLGMDAVAEGIEEEGQAERLAEFGCRGGQGFLFGVPRDAAATLALLRAG